MKFVKLSYRLPRSGKPIKYGWMLMIRNVLDLLAYFEKYECALTKAAYIDLANCVVPKGMGLSLQQHFQNDMSQAIFVLSEIRRQSIIDTFSSLSGGKFKSMADNLPVYMNQNGGWMPASKGMTHTRTVDSDRWPTGKDAEPRYLQWPGGAHWYCKVGAEDVVVGGKQKWASKKEAQRAFRKWLKEQA